MTDTHTDRFGQNWTIEHRTTIDGNPYFVARLGSAQIPGWSRERIIELIDATA